MEKGSREFGILVVGSRTESSFFIRGPEFGILSVRLAETVDVRQYGKSKSRIRHFGRGITFRIITRFRTVEQAFRFRAVMRTAARARAPGPQMIWMAPGSSLAFQRLSRATFSAGSSFRLAGWWVPAFCCAVLAYSRQQAESTDSHYRQHNQQLLRKTAARVRTQIHGHSPGNITCAG
eukprot:gene9778-biopygen3248